MVRFIISRPNIYRFLKNLNKEQTGNYIKMNSVVVLKQRKIICQEGGLFIKINVVIYKWQNY